MDRLLPDKKFYDLVELVYAAGCDPANWRNFAEAVQAHVPGSAFHALFDLKGTQLAFNSATAGIADEFIKSYVEEYGRINPYNAAFSKLPVGRSYVSRELGPDGWLAKDPFHNEWMLPAGNFTHGAGIIVFRDAYRQLRVTLDLPDHLSHLEPLAQDLLDALKPHLQRAFSVNERLAATIATANALEVMITRIEGAAIVLDDQSRVLVFNEAAHALSARTKLLKLERSRKVAFRESHAQSAYLAALSAAVSPVLAPDPHAFRVQGGDFNGLAVVLPLRAGSVNFASTSGPRAKAMLVIKDIDARPVVPKLVCRQAFDLTNAEAELAVRLVQGMTVQEAAENLEISTTTARNQLASVMRKMGVSRQTDLVATLLQLAPTLSLAP